VCVRAQGDGGHGGSLHHGFSEEDLKAHEEATKVKNIDVIVIGQYSITTWYYAPFPEKYNKFSTLYFCEFCLNFFGYKVK
jgi:histone acetyltransferase MYST1